MSNPAARSASTAAKKSDLRSTTAVPQYQHDNSESAGKSAEQHKTESSAAEPKPALAAAPLPTSSPHQRQGDRGGSEDNAAARLPHYVRFHDLRAAGIVSNWAQLYNLINDYGFPAGVMLSPNMRAWRVTDVQAWLEARPTERKKVVAPRSREKEDA